MCALRTVSSTRAPRRSARSSTSQRARCGHDDSRRRLAGSWQSGGEHRNLRWIRGDHPAIAVFGYDGFLYSIGFLVAWLVALLLVAEVLRTTGKFTMADVLSFRLRQRPVRVAAATTLSVSLFYLLAQMAGAGGLVALLLNVH